MFWNVPAMPRSTTSQGLSALMSAPLNTMRPLSARRIRVMRRSSVVLPAPFGPIRPTIPPGEFLPVFEHYRMMPQLDRWVVRHLARRLAKGSRLPCFTMNVSGQTLEDADFPAFVKEELKAARAPVDALVFEIDEADV